MKKLTGTIIKLTGDKAAIMTRECEVLYIKKQLGMYRGLEIQFGSNEIIFPKKKFNLAIKSVSSIAAAIAIIFISLHFFSSYDTYAYVGIDGKTNIEFAIDSNMKVVEARSKDEQTQNIIARLDLKSKSLDVALAEVLKSSQNVEQGVINDECILISAYLKKGESSENNKSSLNVEEILKVCKNSVDEVKEKRVDLKLVGINTESRKSAVKNNISMGRYYLFEKAKEQGVNISLEEAKDKKVGEFVKAVKIDDLSPVSESGPMMKDKGKADDVCKPGEKSKDKIIDDVDPKKEKLPNKKIKEESNGDMRTLRPKAPDEKKEAAPILPKTPEEKKQTAPIVPKAPEEKKEAAPVAPKVTEEEKEAAPIVPRATEEKKGVSPIAPKAPEEKKEAAPIAPKTPEDKKTSAPVAPKAPEEKKDVAPIAPKTPEEKKVTAPIAPKAPEHNKTDAPIVPKVPEEKKEAAPIAPKVPEEKREVAPIAPKIPDAINEAAKIAI